MTAGPLVVFAFLVLPALAALRLARGVGAALALAAAIGGAVSLGGFALAYRADLPAGPVDVLLAAAVWLVAVALGGLRARIAGRRLMVLTGLLASLIGCAHPRAVSSGPFPVLGGSQQLAVLPFRNETGQTLELHAANPLRELAAAAGDPFATPAPTVPEALRRLTEEELVRRGIPLVPLSAEERARVRAPADSMSACLAARRADLPGPVLFARLRRFQLSGQGFLIAWIDWALLDVASCAKLWTASSRRPVPVRGALTLQEVVLDAAPLLLEEAIGLR
jgi:hypothetical protein